MTDRSEDDSLETTNKRVNSRNIYRRTAVVEVVLTRTVLLNHFAQAVLNSLAHLVTGGHRVVTGHQEPTAPNPEENVSYLPTLVTDRVSFVCLLQVVYGVQHRRATTYSEGGVCVCPPAKHSHVP